MAVAKEIRSAHVSLYSPKYVLESGDVAETKKDVLGLIVRNRVLSHSSNDLLAGSRRSKTRSDAYLG